MASPQIEDGYTRIANETMDALARGCPGNGECQLLMAIMRKTYGWNKKEDAISVSQLGDITGLSRRMVIYGLQNLEAKKMVVIIRRKGRGVKNEINTISFQKNHALWVVQEKSEQYRKALKSRKESYRKSCDLVVQEIVSSARNDDLVVQEIVKNNGFLAPTKERKKNKRNIPSTLIELSEKFLQFQQSQFPELIKEIKESKIEEGAKTVQQLIEIDGFNLDEQIRPALKWAVKDSFWSNQILSLAGLRKKGGNGEKKFVNILASMKKVQPGKPTNSDPEWY